MSSELRDSGPEVVDSGDVCPLARSPQIVPLPFSIRESRMIVTDDDAQGPSGVRVARVLIVSEPDSVKGV